jgi:hypothetical protein
MIVGAMRLKTKVKGSTRLVYTGLIGGLEHQKIETMVIDGDVSEETRKVVYYESRNRELKRRRINEGRCDERLKSKVEEST